MHLSDKTRRAANRAVFAVLGDRFTLLAWAGEQPPFEDRPEQNHAMALTLTTTYGGDFRLHIVTATQHDVLMEDLISNGGWFRIFASDLGPHIQGEVGAPGSGADLEISPDPSCMGGYALTLDVGMGRVAFE